MSTYLYAIVRAPPKPRGKSKATSSAKKARTGGGKAPAARLKLPGTGVGNPPGPVRLLRHRDLAAVVSDVPDDYHAEAEGLRGMRRDMRVHSGVVNHVIESATILPFRFGVVFPDDESVVERLLRPRMAQLARYLDALEGSVEITLRVSSVEEQALREAIVAQPELAPPAGGGGRGRGGSLAYESRLERGRQLAAAINDLQQRDARWIIDALTPAVRDLRVGKPLRDLMALNASFLVDRAKLSTFDRTLEKLHTKVGHRLQFDCVGPLPPYSFVDLRL